MLKKITYYGNNPSSLKFLDSRFHVKHATEEQNINEIKKQYSEFLNIVVVEINLWNNADDLLSRLLSIGDIKIILIYGNYSGELDENILTKVNYIIKYPYEKNQLINTTKLAMIKTNGHNVIIDK